MGERRKVPFVLASTVHGPVILNSLDWSPVTKSHVEMGPGLGLLLEGEYDLALISLTAGAIEVRHRSHGPGVVALDCGANIGIYSMEWARAMEGWGSVIAFEPQERIYYALAGNLALNNLFNVKALNKAVGAECGIAEIPALDYCLPNHFGGLSMKQQTNNSLPVEVVSIDSLELPRLDFLKLDIEGMEVEALEGAKNTIERSRPFILCEWHIAGKEPVEKFMHSVGYQTAIVGMNMFAGPPCETMSRFVQLSKTTEDFNVRSSQQNIRAGTAVGQVA